VMTRQTSEAIKSTNKKLGMGSDAGTAPTTAKQGNSSGSEKMEDGSDSDVDSAASAMKRLKVSSEEEADPMARSISQDLPQVDSTEKITPSKSDATDYESDAVRNSPARSASSNKVMPPAYDANQKVAWDLGTLTGVSAAVLGSHFDAVETVERMPELAKFAGKHLQQNVTVNVGEIDAWLLAQRAAGKQADMIFMDLDKTAYEPLYKLIMANNLLKDGGLLVADNVLYRGLPAELSAEGGAAKLDAYEAAGTISQKTRLNAEALVRFNSLVKDDVSAGTVRSLMLPVRDGMMAVVKLGASAY